MKRIIKIIKAEKKKLAKNDFCQWLEIPDIHDAQKINFLPLMYFYVMSIRDFLRLLDGPDDGGVQSTINAHIADEAPHYKWYLENLRQVHPEGISAITLWDKRLFPARRAIYRMISYVLEHKEPVLRIVIILILEAVGEVFLNSTTQLVKRLNMDSLLGFIGSQHQQGEIRHPIKAENLLGVALNEEQFRVAENMVIEAFNEYRGLLQSWKDVTLDTKGKPEIYNGK